ncbi:MAG: hypothetical protein QGH13_02455 [Candidatus Thalassarchaeaceae archaeon]|nr:hypothetical protein [Candidatus Thalassarchaeaceae archaeon]
MRWERMPMGLAFAPFIISMAISCLIMLLDFTPPFELKKPAFTLFLLTPMMVFLPLIHPDVNGRGIERIMGGIVGLHIGFWPIALLALLWPFVVGVLWLIQTASIWRSSYPPFRIGVWVGMGASTGLAMGKIGVELLGSSFLITLGLFTILFPTLHWMMGRLPSDEEE